MMLAKSPDGSSVPAADDGASAGAMFDQQRKRASIRRCRARRRGQ